LKFSRGLPPATSFAPSMLSCAQISFDGPTRTSRDVCSRAAVGG
jgi:hypothetical protein